MLASHATSKTRAADSGHGTEVLVVGAGPTGLLAAILLRRCGVSVRIVDQSPTAAKESRAFGLQARSLEILASIGLAEPMLERGMLAVGAQVLVDGQPEAELNFDDIGVSHAPYRFLLMVPQSTIEEILAAELETLGTSVERGVTLTGIRQDADGVTGELAGGGEMAARYAIGADGAHSVVRKALGLRFDGAPYPQTFLLADCRVTWEFDYDRMKILFRDTAFGLFLPLKGSGLARVMAIDPRANAASDRQGSSPVALDEVQDAFRRAAGPDVALSDATWTSRYRIHHRGVDRYRVGRIFVAGDAAHIHSPAGGQGMNTGLQDAANLAWKLALSLRGHPPEALLESYHDERWPVGQRVLQYTDRLFSFATTQSGWGAAVRDRLLPLMVGAVSRIGPARARAFRFISQLGIRYRPSETVAEDVSPAASSAFRTAPAAGHRAPDAMVARGRDVFSLLAGYRFTVLALSRRALDDAEIAAVHASLEAFAVPGVDLGRHLVAHSLIGRDPRLIQAESSDVFDAYGLDTTASQALYVVRPDGYVAWRSDRLDFEACRRFLSAAFGDR